MLPSSFDGIDSDELSVEQIVHGPPEYSGWESRNGKLYEYFDVRRFEDLLCRRPKGCSDPELNTGNSPLKQLISQYLDANDFDDLAEIIGQHLNFIGEMTLRLCLRFEVNDPP